ncbi:MAG: colanic acid biosynthesis glycosyltransferase WcaL [bacterium]|nr:MAG: colanic acid biosynthesis glycosyltransferase WcaL [bacterium]
MSDANGTRVGYVLKRYPRYSETFIVNEILALEAAGVEIEIFSLLPPTDGHFQDIISRVKAPVSYLEYAGIKTLDFWEAFKLASQAYPNLWLCMRDAVNEEHEIVYQALLLANAIRDKGLHRLHAHFASAAAGVAMLASRFAGVPYSFTTHAKDIFHNNVNSDDFNRKLLNAETVVTVSDYNVDFLQTKYGNSAQNVKRIYNGIDLDRFTFKPPQWNQNEIVAVGRLVEKKGFDDLIRACAILSERNIEFNCRIIGTGELLDDIRNLIKHFDLVGKVELTGPQPQCEIIKHVQNAALFAAPCLVGLDGNRDGLPTVLLEAMALGTPCVSTDVTGIPEAIRNNDTGLLVSQRNPRGLADAIEKLLGDFDLRLRIAQSARRLVESTFDVKQNSAALRNIFCGDPQKRKEPVTAAL